MPPADRGQMVLAWAFARLDTLAFALASAAVFAAALAALTLAIVVKGAPPGVAVGPNLAQLGFYLGVPFTLPGYKHLNPLTCPQSCPQQGVGSQFLDSPSTCARVPAPADADARPR